MRILVLGSGTSHGVPVIGCDCPVCTSADPRDSRYRSSILIESRAGAAGSSTDGPPGEATAVSVDAGPEFRLQAIRARITRLDALLLTHAHADHVGGLDDVRPLTWNRVLPVYGNEATLAETRERFGYIFRETQKGGGKPRIELLPAEAPLRIGSLELVPVPVLHGRLSILGWRSGKFAYITDCSELPETSLPLLAGGEALIVNGLRRKPHETHFSIDQAIGAARRIGAKRTWITHLCHESTHVELESYCAERGSDVGAAPAYDGLEIEVE